MPEAQCKLDVYILPEIYAVAVARYFELEIRLGSTTHWGIGKYRKECNHWMVSVTIGEKSYIPNLCFKTRMDATAYCEQMSVHYPLIAKVLYGTEAIKVSAN